MEEQQSVVSPPSTPTRSQDSSDSKVWRRARKLEALLSTPLVYYPSKVVHFGNFRFFCELVCVGFREELVIYCVLVSKRGG